MAQTFTAQIDAWVLKSHRRADAVIKDATQTTIGMAQKPVAKGGNMPVDTGFLRGSLLSSLIGQTGTKGPESYVLVAGNMEAGDVAEFGWTAKYANYVENGTRGRRGRHFMKTAAAAWPNTVAASVAKAKARIK